MVRVPQRALRKNENGPREMSKTIGATSSRVRLRV